jgi:hypothetical protein
VDSPVYRSADPPPLEPSASTSPPSEESIPAPSQLVQERLACKPKKLAVTETTLHLHWLPPQSTIEQMKKDNAQFLIELYVKLGDTKSLKEVTLRSSPTLIT